MGKEVMVVILQISAAAAAAAFVALVVFMIRTLRSGMRLMEQANATVQELGEDVRQLTGEAGVLLKEGRELAILVKDGAQQLEPMLSAVHTAGEAASEVTKAAKQVAVSLTHTADHVSVSLEKRMDTLAGAASMAATGVKLWQKWQQEKKQKAITKDKES